MLVYKSKLILSVPLCFIFVFTLQARHPMPSSALEYQQTTNSRIVVEENYLRFFTGAIERMTIDGNGNVGIGSTNPQDAKLHIRGGATHYLLGVNRPNSDIAALFLGNDGTTNGVIGANNADLVFGRDYAGTFTEYMRMQNGTGNFGIGTTNPSSKLEIQTTSGNNALRLQAGGNGDHFFQFDSNSQPLYILQNSSGVNRVQLHSAGVSYFNGGSLGIGTSSPVTNLHVLNGAFNLYSGRPAGSYTIGSGTGTLYELFGSDKGDSSGQNQGGFGIVRGAHQISPVVWMYGYGGRNAFQVKKKGWNSSVQSGSTLFHVGVDGLVGVGTTSPGYKLHVEGTTYATKYYAPGSQSWPDYVFEDSYELNDIEEVEKFIEKNHHLPEIPSAAEVEANGIDIIEMQAKLLQKIEELTLYVIEQNKKIEEQQQRIKKLEKTQHTARGQ